jgi:hypothetical protein
MAYRPTAPKQCPYIHPDNPVPLIYYHDSDPPASGEYDPVEEFLYEFMQVISECYMPIRARTGIQGNNLGLIPLGEIVDPDFDEKLLGYAPENIDGRRKSDIIVISKLVCSVITETGTTETVLSQTSVPLGSWSSLPYIDGSKPQELRITPDGEFVPNRPWYNDAGMLTNLFWRNKIYELFEGSEGGILEGLIERYGPPVDADGLPVMPVYREPNPYWSLIDPSRYDFKDSNRNKKQLPIFNPRDRATQDWIAENIFIVDPKWTLTTAMENANFDRFIPVDENLKIPKYMMNEIRAWYYYNFPEEDSWPQLFLKDPNVDPCPEGILERKFIIECIDLIPEPDPPPAIEPKPEIWRGFKGPAA